MPPPTGLVITNPLVLYRALVSTNRIAPDPAQHRLALHLQKLYERLIDYEPRAAYRQRLENVTHALKKPSLSDAPSDPLVLGRRGVWKSLLEQKEKRESLALTRVLTSHEEAMQLNSPKGLMLHGDVGTGKSMLIDLFADCLPRQKKRRWHYDAFMLETFAKLERLRCAPTGAGDEYSLLWLAKDLIDSSPILFLDEFQLPDRTAAKIMSNLMTSFFQLGGVLIATSNRMPDELAKAAGIEFAPPPSRLQSLGWRLGRHNERGRGSSMFAGQREYADFMSLLNARCEVWEMEGNRDYRRSRTESISDPAQIKTKTPTSNDTSVSIADPFPGSESFTAPEMAPNDSEAPTFYFISPGPNEEISFQDAWVQKFKHAQARAVGSHQPSPWKPTALKVYGRLVAVPRAFNGAASFTFAEICANQLGPADYITLASTFHTVIITEVPYLTLLLKNEARRFITLLDAMYEARCKLLISAAAGPDELFFPDIRQATGSMSSEAPDAQNQDGVYPETFSEIYQDINAPFRPNISSYSSPDTTHARLQGVLPDDALEDQPPNRLWRRSDSSVESAGRQDLERDRFEVRGTPDFSQTAAFTGEDERFAYKRAASRLWEMCGKKWWDRQEEGWWRPLPRDMRRWEGNAEVENRSEGVKSRTVPLEASEGSLGSRDVTGDNDKIMFRHGASPFRAVSDPPPKIGWTHVWGTVKWGKRAGAWGQGVEGLKDRKKG